MSKKQEELIKLMNEFCSETFDLSYPRTKEEAKDYISRNIEEYKRLTSDNWSITNSYF